MTFDPTKPSASEGTFGEALDATRSNLNDVNDRLKAQENLALASTKNEVVAARGSKSTVKDRLAVAINDDGSLKFESLKNMTWIASGDVPTYVSAQSFTVPGDQTAKYLSGLVLRLMHGTTQIHSVVSVASYLAGTDKTTVSLQQSLLTPALSSVLIGLASLGEVLYENAINRTLDPLDRISRKPMARGAVFPIPGRRTDSIIQPDIRGTLAYRRDKFDKLSQVSVDVLRQEYERDILIGWMIEGQRQNVAINSNTALGGTGFSAGGDTASNQSTSFKFPLDTAASLVKAETGLTFRYSQNYATVLDKHYTFSIYLAYEDGRDINAEFGSPGTEASPINPFSIVADGAPRTWASLTKETYQDGSMRVWIPVVATSNLVRGWGVLIRDVHKTVSSKLFASGFQVEPDANFPSSYMPTGSFPVIRDADKVRTLTSNLPDWRDRESFSRFDDFWTAIGQGATPQYASAFDDGSTNNLITVFRVNTGQICLNVLNEGTFVVTLQGPVVTGRQRLRTCWSIERNKTFLTVAGSGLNLGNGINEPVTTVIDTDCEIPRDITTLTIGNRSSDMSRAGFIRHVQGATLPGAISVTDAEAMCRFP
jgi:hypothetical protein